MIIDIHNHPDWIGYNLNRYLDNMEKYNIDKTWLLSWEAPLDEYDPVYYDRTPEVGPRGPIPFTHCITYIERAPEKFILGYAPDPRRPEAIDLLQQAISLYGVQVYGELKLRMMYDNPDALRMYRFCGKKGLPVILHLDYEFDTGVKYPRPNWWYGGGIEALERAVKACPETAFIGHAGGFWAHISNDDMYDKEMFPKSRVVSGGKLITMLQKYPNLHCDLSGFSGRNSLTRDLEFAKEFLLEFQDRLLYGRDYFDNVLQEVLNGIGLPAVVLEKIYSGNALKILTGGSGK